MNQYNVIRYSFALIVLLASQLSFAQPSQPTAPSAAVYNYSKYADVAPHLFTGALSEAIPLGNVSAGPLQHAVGLSYYFAGHRPSDLSGPEGLGFHLQGGGAITRRVMGLDDFDDGGWLATGHEVQGLGGLNASQVSDYISEDLDPQPDIYSLQAGGLNIKFVMDHNGMCHTVPRSDLEITYVTDYYDLPLLGPQPYYYFLLKDTEGNRYYFGERHVPNTITVLFNTEKTTFNNSDHISAWYLYRIETHDGLHGIDFEYISHDYKYHSLQDCEIVKWNDDGSGGTVGDDCEMTAEEVEIEGKVIHKIIGLGSSIEFGYEFGRLDLRGSPRRLDTVAVHTGGYTKTYTFQHSYFTGSGFTAAQAAEHLDMTTAEHAAMVRKLRLTSIDISGRDSEGGTVSIPSYAFDYYRPFGATTGPYVGYATVNKAIDGYGFANGQFNNNNKKHIVPTTTVNFPGNQFITFGGGSTIRNSNGDYSITTGLYQMTLPTGGSITYNYEPNKYYDNSTSILTPGSFNVAQLNCSNNNFQYSLPVGPTLTQHQIDYGWIEWMFTPECPDEVGIFEILFIRGADTIRRGPYVDMVHREGDFALNTLSPALTPGPYNIVLKISKARGTAYFKHPTSGTEEEVGGIRLVSRITNDGDLDPTNNIERTFTYVDNQGNSSGRIYRQPVFGYELDFLNTVDNALFSTASITPFSSYQGHHMGYEQAGIDYNGNGRQEQQYYTDLNIAVMPSFPPTPEQPRSLWGQSKGSIIYREGDNAILQQSRSYINPPEYNESVNTNMIAVRRVPLRANTGSTILADYDLQYSINTGTFRPDSISSSLEGLSKTQVYTYGSANHLQAMMVSDTFSNGEAYNHMLTYTVDPHSIFNSPQEDSLISRNIIKPRTDTYVMNSKNVNKSETFYGNWGTGQDPRPLVYQRDFYDESGMSVSESDQVMAYNAMGLMTAFRRHGYTTNDVFSYDSNSLMMSAGLSGLTRSFLYHPGSHLVSSIIEVDGTMTDYEYDGLMRLEKVTDPVGATTEWEYNITTDIVGHTSHIKTTSTYPADANGLSQLTSLEDFAYIDGLGRTVQTVGKAQTYSGNDQVRAIRYDEQGRAHRAYEPYGTTTNTGAYSLIFPFVPYTETSFESSPLNRPDTITPPDFGARTFTYGTNTTQVTGADNTSYPVGTLYLRTIVDGNGNVSQSYQDIQGRSVMHRRVDTIAMTASYLDTKIDHDWRNLEIEIVPPGSTLGTNALNFIYEYDNEGKTVRKKVPSKDWIDYVYDDRDLLIGYQDSYMEQQSEPWYIYQYDNWGREVASGYNGSQPTNASTIPATILTQTAYGTSGTARGKVTGTEYNLLNTTDDIIQISSYDAFGRLSHQTSNSIYNVARQDRIDYKYDGASNVVKVIENARLGSQASDERTVIFSTNLDNDGRAIAEYIELTGQGQRQLCEKTYNDKDLVAINYQGGNANNYLQQMDFIYLSNRSLNIVNAGTTSGSDLYGYRLNYTGITGMTNQTSQPAVPQYNGNINSIIWAQSGQSAEYHNYRYDDLDRLTNDYTAGDTYNTSYGYDMRGNFSNITRYHNGTLIDSLTYNYVAANDNQIADISEDGDQSKGYIKVSEEDYEYDGNGNMDKDPQKGITISYNHLDLPDTIAFDDGRQIICLYDASGRLWSKILKDADGMEIQRKNHVGSFELIDDILSAVMHTEGRMVNQGLEDYLSYLYLDHQQKVAEQFRADEIESTGEIALDHTEYEGRTSITLSRGFEVLTGAEFTGEIVGAGTYSESWRYDWDIRDHLGNLRIIYTGPDSNNLDVLQRQTYYPYGLAVGKNLNTALENKYAYNGIEHVGEFGLQWEMATYRSLDSRGVWNSVDPAAEKYAGLSPYQSNGNNPISFSDPHGDDFGLSFLIGAGIGLLSNGAANISQGNGFFNGGLQAALIGGIGGAASFGIGEFTNALSTTGANLTAAGVSNSLGTLSTFANIGGHAALGGLSSVASGGGFGSGALSGGFGAGSGMAFSGLGSAGMLASSGSSGGVGSVLGGGNFWDGAGHGLISGGLNHVAHQVQEKINLLKEKRLIKKLICRCLEEYSTNPLANLKNIIEDNNYNYNEVFGGSTWVGGSFNKSVTLNGHRYKIFIDGLHNGNGTGMTGVGFNSDLGRVFQGGSLGGRGGFYVTGQQGAQLVSISATSGKTAYFHLRQLFNSYKYP